MDYKDKETVAGVLRKENSSVMYRICFKVLTTFVDMTQKCDVLVGSNCCWGNNPRGEIESWKVM